MGPRAALIVLAAIAIATATLGLAPPDPSTLVAGATGTVDAADVATDAGTTQATSATDESDETGPRIGDDPADLDLRALEGQPLDDGTTAIPLRAPQPDWLTDEVTAEVDASEDGVVAAPAEAPLPGWVGIRPGSWMVSPAGCTMNFVFRDGDDLAIGTAGHCFEEARGGDPVLLLTLHPESEVPVLVEIGPVLYETPDYEIGEDFALVAIPDHLHSWVDPTIAVVSGPCGTHDGTVPDSVWHYGHGLAVGTGGTPRAGVLTHWDGDAYAWSGVANFGDSGSAVRVTDFGAAGNLTHLVVSTEYLPAYIAGTTIDHILELIPGWGLAETSACPAAGGDLLPGDGGDDGDGDGDGDDGRSTGRPAEPGPDNDRRSGDGRGNGDGRSSAARTAPDDRGGPGDRGADGSEGDGGGPLRELLDVTG